MKRFVLRRLGYAAISLCLLSLTIFLFVRVTGDPTVLLVEPGRQQRRPRGAPRPSSGSTARSSSST